MQQLFFLGAIAIGVGVITFSRPVMMTVGRGIIPLTPVAAFVSVVSHAIVLFLFSSVALQYLLLSNGLPAIPLIPVSSSQAIVGAVVGIAGVRGLKGLKQIRWNRVGGIVAGWAATPLMAGAMCFFALFIMQNVFTQQVFVPLQYKLGAAEMSRLEAAGLPVDQLEGLVDREFASGVVFRYQLGKRVALDPGQQRLALEAAEVVDPKISPEALAALDVPCLGAERAEVLPALRDRRFDRRWKLEDAVLEQSDAWAPRDATPIHQLYNKERRGQLGYVYETFTVRPEEEDEFE